MSSDGPRNATTPPSRASSSRARKPPNGPSGTIRTSKRCWRSTTAGLPGFCAWRQTAPDEAELLNLGVDPGARRKGVASALLDALCTHAQGEIFLEVAEPNAPAIALYVKRGWTPVAVREGYYEQGRINAVVMKKRSW